MIAWTQVGVGAWVVNEHKEVLVVQERSGPLKVCAIGECDPTATMLAPSRDMYKI